MRGRSDPIQTFATTHRLKTRIAEDGTKIIPGKFGHLYFYDHGVFGVTVIPDRPRRQYWGYVRAALLKAGFTVVQDCDGEGAAIFDPANTAQAKEAIRAAGITRKRQISPEQRDRQIQRLRASAGRAPSAAETRRERRVVVEACSDLKSPLYGSGCHLGDCIGPEAK